MAEALDEDPPDVNSRNNWRIVDVFQRLFKSTENTYSDEGSGRTSTQDTSLDCEGEEERIMEFLNQIKNNPADMDKLKTSFGSQECDKEMLEQFLETIPSVEALSERKTRKDFSSRRDVVTTRPGGRSVDALRNTQTPDLHSEDDYPSSRNSEKTTEVFDEDVYDQEGDHYYTGEEDTDDTTSEDLGSQINELFRHIYNEEKASVEKLKAKVFPQLEKTCDSYIINAIESSMNIVRDQVRQNIQDNICIDPKTSSLIQERRIFDMNNENYPKFKEVISTVIDFYKLFERSTPSIIEVWGSKLTHVPQLSQTLDLQHKSKFFQKIWKDGRIYQALKVFSNTQIIYDSDSSATQERLIKDLTEIDRELAEADAILQKQTTSSKKKRKKNKNKQKAGKHSSGKKKEESNGGPQLHDIDDIDELVAMIQNNDKSKKSGKKKNKKIKKSSKEASVEPVPSQEQENDSAWSNGGTAEKQPPHQDEEEDEDKEFAEFRSRIELGWKQITESGGKKKKKQKELTVALS